MSSVISSIISGLQPGQSAQQLATQQLANQGIASLAGSLLNQGPQVGSAAEIVASGINNQDPNNLSSTGFGGVVTQANSNMNPGVAQEATGAPTEDYGQGYRTNWKGGFAGPTGGGAIRAGMATAMGYAPVATAGNFNPQTQFAANKMFGNGTQFVKPKKLINL
jgi:hypothetical protein